MDPDFPGDLFSPGVEFQEKIVAQSLTELKERADKHFPHAPLYTLVYLDNDVGEYVDVDDSFFNQHLELLPDDVDLVPNEKLRQARVNVISTKSSVSFMLFYLLSFPILAAIPTLLYFMKIDGTDEVHWMNELN